MRHDAVRWLALLLVPSLGCMIYVRDEEHLRDETRELVSARAERIEACYGDLVVNAQMALESRERARQGPYADIGPAIEEQLREQTGRVVVRVRFAPGSGVLSQVVVDEARSTGPTTLQACVTEALAGVVLEPADSRVTEVVYAWDFALGERLASRPAQMVIPTRTSAVDAPEGEAGLAPTP